MSEQSIYYIATAVAVSVCAVSLAWVLVNYVRNIDKF